MAQCKLGAMNPFCATLSDEARSRFCEHSRKLELARNEKVSVSSVKGQVAILRHGVLVNRVLGEGDKGVMSFIASSGSLLNLARVSLRYKERSGYTGEDDLALALTPCEFCLIPISLVRDLISENVQFAREMFDRVSARYLDTLEQLSLHASAPVEQRMRSLLESLEEAGLDVSRLTHEQIAWALGVNRVTVTKLMRSVWG